MHNDQPEAVLHRMMTAGLAQLMQLPPPGSSTRFTVASATLDEGDPAIEQLMRSAAASQVDLLLAVIERRRDCTTGHRLMLITSTDNVTRALEVDPVSTRRGLSAILVSADRREAWQHQSGRLTPVEVPQDHIIARGIEAAIASIDDLMASAAPVAAQLKVHELAAYRRPQPAV